MNLNKIKRISIGTFLVLWTAMYGSCIYNNHQESKIKEAEQLAKYQEKQKMIEAENVKKEYFISNKDKILSDINELIEKEDLINAKNKIDEYLKLIKTPSLLKLKAKLNIKIKEEKLKEDIGLDEKIKITEELSKISDDKKYEDLLMLLINKKKAIKRQELLEKIEKTDKKDIDKNYDLYKELYENTEKLTDSEMKNLNFYAEEKLISKSMEMQFSNRDGSNVILVQFVKTVMNDPKSFEHINTIMYKTDDKTLIDVVMMYRGKNAFGAKVVNTVKARISLITNSILSIKNE